MIEDREVALALGWRQAPGRGQLRLPGGVEQQVMVWFDEAGQRHPLRPFTASYDVMLEEARKRGLEVAFRSDSDQVVVWLHGRPFEASSSKGLPLVEGLCACVLDQLGLLDALPVGKGDLLRVAHLRRNFAGDLLTNQTIGSFKYEVLPTKYRPPMVPRAVAAAAHEWLEAHPGEPLPSLIPVKSLESEKRPWWKRLLRLS